MEVSPTLSNNYSLQEDQELLTTNTPSALSYSRPCLSWLRDLDYVSLERRGLSLLPSTVRMTLDPDFQGCGGS